MKNLPKNLFITLCYTFAFVLMLPGGASAEETCNFTRHLELEVVGEDVKCLQKYLNKAGYTIADSGVGSSGRETTQFKSLTEAAVIKWQKANGLYPTVGYFGDQSIAKYKELIAKKSNSGSSSNSGSGSTDSTETALLKQIQSLQGEIAAKQKTMTTPSTTSSSSLEKKFKTEFNNVVKYLKDAKEELEDGDPDPDRVPGIKKDIDDAEDALFDAVVDYFKGQISDAIEELEEALDDAKDAFEDAGGQSREEEVDDLLDELEDEYEEIEKDIEDAEDDDEDVDDAKALLKKAKAKIKAARELLDDREYDDAEDEAKEAEDYLEDAIDELDRQENIRDEARDEIKDAKDEIDDAEDEIDEADDDGDDVDEAEDLLDDAEDYLDRAEEEYEDEDYDQAISYAKKAQDAAKDAVRAID